MEILLVLIVLGAAVFYFLKGNVRRGAETVRASVFLTGLESGSTVAEANLVASMDAEHMPASMIHNAMDHVRLVYGGKQLPMIAEAYRKGMKPKLALWNQVLINIFFPRDHESDSTPPSTELRTDAVENDGNGNWVRPFALYYLASEFAKEVPGDMPRCVREFVSGNLSTATEQSLLVNLRNYLPFAYRRDRASDDLRQAIQEARVLVRAELQTGNSRLALTRFLRRMHTDNGTMTISQDEFDSIVAETVDQIKQSDEASAKMRARILKDGIEEMFTIRHGKAFDAYEREMQGYGPKVGA